MNICFISDSSKVEVCKRISTPTTEYDSQLKIKERHWLLSTKLSKVKVDWFINDHMHNNINGSALLSEELGIWQCSYRNYILCECLSSVCSMSERIYMKQA